MTNNYLFPSRGDDLGPGQVWVVDEFNEGRFILDLDVQRFDSNLDQWTFLRPGITQEEYRQDRTNDKHLAWGVPLYAPVSGVVKSVWRNFPDNPAPGERDTAPAGEFITWSGNHVMIQADDGENFLIAHMMRETVPEDLCHLTALTDDYMDSDARIGTYRAASFIKRAAARPRVSEGDFIGRAGSSGRSDWPHIHIAANALIDDTNVVEDEQAHRFYRGWRQPLRPNRGTDPEAWVELDGQEFTSAAGNTMFLPTPFLRRSTALAGKIRSVAMARAPTTRLLTAAVGAGGNLSLNSWDPTPEDLQRNGDDAFPAGRVTEAKVVKLPTGDRVATVVRDDDGNLRVIGWHLLITGRFTRIDAAEGAKASQIAATGAALESMQHGVVTAARDQSGRLSISTWSVGPDAVTEIARTLAPQTVTAVHIATMTNFPFGGVAVGARDTDGNLFLSTWEISDQGRSIAMRGEAAAGAVSALQLVTTGLSTELNRHLLVTPVRHEERLRIIAWERTKDGGLTRRGTATAGEISELAACTVGHATLVTAVRTPDGAMKCIAWRLSDGGQVITRTSGVRADQATALALYSAVEHSRWFVVAGMRDGDGDLRLINYEANCTP